MGQIPHRKPKALTDKADVTQMKPAGVYLVNRDRRILSSSKGMSSKGLTKGAEELTGYRAMEVVGQRERHGNAAQQRSFSGPEHVAIA